MPSPWWVRVVRVVIPPSQCDEAGRLLAQAFGPEEIAGVVGGEQWWQRRGQKDGGVEGEWIAMKEDWKHVKPRDVQHAGIAGAASRTNPHADGDDKSPHKLHRKSKKAEGRPRRGTWKEELGDDIAWREEERKTYKTARKAFNRAASSEKQKQKDIEKARKRHARSERKKGEQEEKEMKEGTRPNTPIPEGSGFATEEETDVEQSNAQNGESKPKSSDEKAAEGVYAEEMDEMRCMLYIHGGGYVRHLHLPAIDAG